MPEQQTEQQSAWIENMRRMNFIVGEMKEIPVLPSEEAKEVNPLQRVEFPESGGILTYMEGKEYPYKGFPYYEFVDTVDKIKKLGKARVSGLYHAAFKGNKLKLITLLPAFWLFKKVVYIEVYTFYRMVERFRVKPLRYCQAMRELYRSFSLKDDEFRLMIRDLLCMVLEFDNAYRYRFQDLIVEMDKEALNKKPIKEINRVIDIAISREVTQEVKDMWTLVKILVNYLRFDKKLKETLVDVLSQLNINEVELKIEDKHYCEGRKDYVFGFQKSSQKNVS